MEVSKFWTKTRIIIIVIFLIIIGSIIGFIYFKRAKLRKEYIKLENQFNNYTYNYLLYEQITLKDNEYKKIDIKKIIKDGIINNKRANDCEGYVIAENNTKAIDYTTYLKCKNIYTTKGYGKVVTSKKQNDTVGQSEKDTTKPVITLLGSATMTINVGDTYKEKGATAIDNIDGNISKKIKITGEVNTKKAGTYKITYSVTDKAGNKATVTRKVIVKEGEKVDDNKDTTVPVITFKMPSAYQKVCIGDKVDISRNGIYGYTAYDDVDGDITGNVRISGETSTMNVAGEYTLKYSIKDTAGNETISTRKFSVVDCSASNNTTTTQTPTPEPTPAPTPAPSTNNNNNNNTTTPDTSSSSSSSSSNTTPSTTPSTNVQTNPTGISAPDSLIVSVGSQSSINASVLPSNASNKTLNYRSTNTSVATVDSNGVVKGIKKGETRIIITTSNGKTKGVFVTVE